MVGCADSLRQCNSVIMNIEGLKILSDERENRNMLAKLSEWLVNR